MCSITGRTARRLILLQVLGVWIYRWKSIPGKVSQQLPRHYSLCAHASVCVCVQRGPHMHTLKSMCFSMHWQCCMCACVWACGINPLCKWSRWGSGLHPFCSLNTLVFTSPFFQVLHFNILASIQNKSSFPPSPTSLSSSSIRKKLKRFTTFLTKMCWTLSCATSILFPPSRCVWWSCGL